MPQIINTNIMSLNAQRQLNKSQRTQTEAMERLSSGLRINSAKDDAAGLAISTNMQSQIKGINQAVRNANDGVSMAQTAEGAMDEMTNILQRMRELSIQAGNGTNSNANRDSIQIEIDQLYSEIDRISSSTQFNGALLLDGSCKSTTLQIGANNNETITFSIQNVSSSALGLNGGISKGELNSARVATPGSADSLEINDIKIPPAALSSGKGNAVDAVKAINLQTHQTGVTATAYNAIEGSIATGKTTGLTIKVGDNAKITLSDTGSMLNLAETINRDVPDLYAQVNAEGQLQLSNSNGARIEVGGNIENSGLEAMTYEGYLGLKDKDGEAIKISGADPTQFGLMTSNGASSLTGKGITVDSDITVDDKLQINGEAIEVIGKHGQKATTADKIDAINRVSEKTFITASKVEVLQAGGVTGLETIVIPGSSITGTAITDADVVAMKALYEGDPSAAVPVPGVPATLNINGTDINLAGVDTVEKLVTRINDTAATNVFAEVNDDGKMQFTNNETPPGDVVITEATPAKLNGTDATQSTIQKPAVYGIVLSADDNVEINITSDAETKAGREAALDKLGVISTGGTQIIDFGINVRTAENASKSLGKIDDALTKISDSRANLGAIQNRLGSTISNLENVSQNLAASRSRIFDADFAAETSKMSKSQILQQAGTSMLAQANASSQNVLSLLQG